MATLPSPAHPHVTSAGSNRWGRSACFGSTRTLNPNWPLAWHGTLPLNTTDFALPLPEAVGHATREAAWASFLEGERGMLRAGLAADVVVLDRNPFALGPASLLPARVLRTIVGGRTVATASPA